MAVSDTNYDWVNTLKSNSHKVLFYIPGLSDGGGERLWAALATAFHERGYDVLFAQDFEAKDNRKILHQDIPVHTLGPRHLTSIRNLAKLLKEARPDVALSAIAGSNLKLVAARLLSRAPTKVIQTFHGHNEWQNGWLSYLTARALPLTSRLSAQTLAVSEQLSRDLAATWGAKSSRTLCIQNPVLFPRSTPALTATELAERPPVVLAVGRLSPEKDYATLLAAFAGLQRSDAQLVILGKGPEEAHIKALFSQMFRKCHAVFYRVHEVTQNLSKGHGQGHLEKRLKSL